MGRSIKKIVCCDTIHHLTPILRGWYFGFNDLGYDCTYLPIPQYSPLDLEESPDLLIYAGVKLEHLSMLKSFHEKHPNCIVVGITPNYNQYYEKMHDCVDYFVTLLDESPYLDESFKTIGYDLIHTPLAGNNHLFYPQPNTPKIYDVCFIGGLSHGDRGEFSYLYPLLDNPHYKCYLAGMSYKNHGGFILPYEKANPIRNSTKVNINFHFPYQKLGEGNPKERVDLNQSVYNIALSGQFQLCDHPLASSMFDNNIVLSSKKDWVDMVEYYKENEDIALNLANKAYNIAIKNHTWKARMKTFLSNINVIHEK